MIMQCSIHYLVRFKYIDRRFFMVIIEKAKRGANYDYVTMLDMYYSGKNYKEIANLMNTKSVQSV